MWVWLGGFATLGFAVGVGLCVCTLMRVWLGSWFERVWLLVFGFRMFSQLGFLPICFWWGGLGFLASRLGTSGLG